jgi:hypothetical protein
MNPPIIELVVNPSIHKIISTIAMVVNIFLMVGVVFGSFLNMVTDMFNILADTLECATACR